MKLKKQKLQINGMHCTSCAMNIDFDLEDLEGVEKAQTSYAKQQTEVEFDEEKINEETIIKTIKNTGYTAIPLKQDSK